MSQQLVLLHGFTGSGEDWAFIRPQLEPQYTLITPDIVGHGDADKPDDRRDYALAGAAQRILDDVDGRFHLLGYSMGGRLALYIAAQHPQRVQSLILESASPGLKTQAERAARKQGDDALADQIEANGMAWFADFWESLPLWDSQTREQKAQLRLRRLQNDPVGLANSLRGMGTGVMPNLWQTLPQMMTPAQLIVGERDRKFVDINREMAQIMPQAQLSVVPEAGHTVHLEAPDAFLQIVSEFLSAKHADDTR